ncbi:metallophosphoesterase [Hyphococcus formosus]|uniref:metallophosphoesterase family protein n=1 Tax=Hyphococcus formosus TaxID=3143534 RepID=UPI00398BB92B
MMANDEKHIAHISDLHFGAASDYAVNALIDDLETSKPDIVVITGDLTQAGRRKEFEAAREFLGALSAKKLIVPGNHDLPVINLWSRFITPYNRFERFLSGMINPVYTDEMLTIAGLNTARRAALDVNWSYGRISRTQIINAADYLDRAPSQNIKVIAAHHPFTKGPGRAGSRIVGRGREAMTAFADKGLDIALTGHVHHSSAKLYEIENRKLVMIQAGTATSVRTRQEPPAYNDIFASASGLTVQTRFLQGNKFTGGAENRFIRDKSGDWNEE